MPKNNYELKALAKQNLQGHWPLAIVVCVIAWLLTDAFTGNNGREAVNYIWQNGQFVKTEQSTGYGLLSFLSFILAGPVNLGLAGFFLNLARSEEARLENLLDGFRQFLKTFILNLLITVFVILWFLLLIIPGFIAILRYSMAYYILRDNPELTPLEAITRSKEMMYGHKTRLFLLWLSFIGWFLVAIITFGLGFLYLIPYYNATKANFYEDLRLQSA